MKTKAAKKRLGRLLLLDGLILVLIGAFYLLSRAGIGIPCLFRRVTGWLCPGCGNSRAALALLRLDLAAAFRHNPLFAVELGYIGWIYCAASRNYLRGKRFSYQPPLPVADLIVLIAVAAWGLIRNLL